MNKIQKNIWGRCCSSHVNKGVDTANWSPTDQSQPHSVALPAKESQFMEFIYVNNKTEKLPNI